MSIKEILDSKISLEVLLVELIEAFFDWFGASRLCKCKIFIVSELTKVFAHHILKIVKHSGKSLYSIGIYFLLIL